MSKAAYRDFVVEIVRKLAGQQGFRPLPRSRWVVERTFGWMVELPPLRWLLRILCGRSGDKARSAIAR
jgi:hypothetical protein